MANNLNLWKARIQRAESVQNKQHNLWKDSVSLFNCTYFENTIGGEIDKERVDVHFANWYISNLIPLVYFRDPFIFIKSTHDKYSGFASTMEKVINYYWKELGLKQEFKRVIMSSLLMPPGWMKIGYTAKIGQDIGKLDEIKEKAFVQKMKDVIKGVLKSEKEKRPEEQGVINEYIKEENVFATWVPSWNMLMPEGYHLVSRMPYLIEIEDISRVDFLANPLYKNKDSIKTNTNINIKRNSYTDPDKTRVTTPSYHNLGASTDTENDIIRLYHVEDKREQKRFTISMEANGPHFEGDLISWEGFSYKPLFFEETLPTRDISNPYPPNVLEPIFPQIMEQANARTQMVKWRKRASSIVLVQKGLADEKDVRQLEETEGVQIVYVSNISAFQMQQTPNLPTGIFDVNEIINQDLQMGTNMGQMMFQPQPGQRTATQAQIGQSGLQLKASARVDVVEDYTVTVAKTLAQYIWNFYDRQQISEIIGEQVTPQMWIDLPREPRARRRMLQAELQFNIDAGSAAPPKDETVDRKQLLDFASIVNAIAPEKIKKGSFIEKLSDRFKFVKDIDQVVKTDEEGEIRTAQLENQYMQQGMPQAVSPNEDHEIHIQQHAQVQPPNEIVDRHISEHAQYLGIQPQSGVGNKPQAGDTRPPLSSTNPEINRQGQTNQGDIYQSVQNTGVGTTAEAK